MVSQEASARRMRYIVLIYAVFILLFDFWSNGSQAWNVVYFTVQYVFAGSVALSMLLSGRYYRVLYLLVAAFFYMMAILELSMLRFDPPDYFFKITDTQPLLSCGIIFVMLAILLILLKKYIK